MAKNINVILSLQDRFTTKMSQASVATLQFKRNLAIAQATSDKFAGVMHKMETAAAVGVTAAVTATTAAVKTSLDAYKEFNGSMNEVAGIKSISATSEEMVKLTGAAKEASKAVKGTTYKDAADTLKYMALAGWNTTQSMTALTPILKGVRINGGQVQETADAITDSMTALGLTSDQTAEYIDKCAAVQSSSNTNMLQLNEALIKCGSLMKDLGIETRETNGSMSSVSNDTMALIGALSSAGKKGVEAGTAVRSLYQRFMKDTAEAQDGLDEIGLSVYTDTGEMKEIPSLLEEMSEKLKKLNHQERNSALSKIGGRFANELQVAMDAMTIVGEDGRTAYQKMKEAIEDSQGAADRFIDALGSGWSGAVDNWSSSWKNFCAEMGETIAPYATDALNYVTGKLPTIEEWLKSNLPTALDKGKEIVIEIKNTLEEFKPEMEWIVEHWKQIATVAGTAYAGMGAFRLGTAGVEAYGTLGKIKKGIGKEKAAKAAAAENVVGLLVPDITGKKKKGVPIDTSSVVSTASNLNIFDNAKSVIPKFDHSKTKMSFYGKMLEFDHDDLVQKGLTNSNGLINTLEEYSMYEDIVSSVNDVTDSAKKPGILKRLFGGAKKVGGKAAGVADNVAGKAAGAATRTSLTGAIGAGSELAAATTAGAVTGGGATAGTVGGTVGASVGSAGSALAGLAGPAAILVAIVVTLIGMWKNSEKFRESIKNLSGTVKDKAVKAFGGLKDSISKAKESAQPFFDVCGSILGVMGDVAAIAINVLSPFVGSAVDLIGLGLGAIIEGIGGAFGKVGEAIDYIANTSLVQFLKDCIDYLGDLSEEFREFIGLVTDDEPSTAGEYKPDAYTGTHSSVNGTITQQTNPSGGVSDEAEGGEGDSGGVRMVETSDGWKGVPSSSSTIGDIIITDKDKIRIRNSDAFTTDEKIEQTGMGPLQVNMNALGTNYWRGGITSVNERGGEIMDLPKGTRIIPADKSKKIADNVDKGVTVIVNIENYYGEDEAYINRIGSEVGHRLAQVM